jgi:hypothetical protein
MKIDPQIYFSRLDRKTLNKLIHPKHLLSNALNIQEPNLINHILDSSIYNLLEISSQVLPNHLLQICQANQRLGNALPS